MHLDLMVVVLVMLSILEQQVTLRHKLAQFKIINKNNFFILYEPVHPPTTETFPVAAA